MLLHELSATFPPETHCAFWLEDCDWPMPWLARVTATVTATATTLLSCCIVSGVCLVLCVCVIIHESAVFPPETHCAFWLEDCDWPMPWLAVLPPPLPLPLPPCCPAALFPVFVWLCVFALFPEPAVLPPETTPLFWLEDCDWPMPWLAVLPPPLPLPPLCAAALFPVFVWLWYLRYFLNQLCCHQKLLHYLG